MVSNSIVEKVIARRIAVRCSQAADLAGLALRDLAARGIGAWIVGSLAKGTFGLSSDIDFLVDCDAASEPEAFRAIEAVIGDFPFHFLPYRRLCEGARRELMKEAIDSPGICPCPPPAD